MVKLKDKVSRATDRINYEIRNEKDELIEIGEVTDKVNKKTKFKVK